MRNPAAARATSSEAADNACLSTTAMENTANLAHVTLENSVDALVHFAGVQLWPTLPNMHLTGWDFAFV